MTTIRFNYERWQPNDVLPFRAGSESAFRIVQDNVDLGHLPSRNLERSFSGIGLFEDQVMEIIAASIEWLRHRGISGAEIESKVHGYLAREAGTERYNVLKDAMIEEHTNVVPAPQRDLDRLSDAAKAAIRR
jgi:hypothetical protein